jgi:hypothetical protein
MRHGAFDRVHVRGPVPLEEALRMQRDANGLVLLDWVVDDAGVLTGKVFEYLAAEAPILVVGPSQTSPALALVEEAGRGVHLGNDPTGIAEALNALFIDRTTELPTARADVVARYDRERLAIACLERVRSVHEAAEASR